MQDACVDIAMFAIYAMYGREEIEYLIVQTDIEIYKDGSGSKMGTEEFSIPDFVYTF